MKKIKIDNQPLQLNKSKVTNLSSSEMADIKGGFTSIISCHTHHAGSACSGCQTCCPEEQA
jgi:hypothetical protein